MRSGCRRKGPASRPLSSPRSAAHSSPLLRLRASASSPSPKPRPVQDGPLDSRTKLVLYNALATCNGQCGRKTSKLPNCLCRFAPPPEKGGTRDKGLW